MNKPIPMFELPETVEVSTIFTDEERPKQHHKNYLKPPKLSGQGAFHEKSEKNKKVNSGSPALKRKKYKKPIKRSGKGKR